MTPRSLRGLLRGCVVAVVAVHSFLCHSALAQEPTRDDVEFFENKIRPLLVERCFKCHGGDAKKGGLKLDSRDAILKGGRSGPAAVAGNPTGSLLMRAVRGLDTDLKMPPGDGNMLSAAQIDDLSRWIKSGLPFPGAAAGSVARASIDLDAARKFWSYQPLRRSIHPPDETIDRFVRAQLDAKKMTPSAPADKRTLLRRATYDLTGLPPTAEEIDAFLKDNSPDAYAKAVDRLLASPQYGVHWARHWLDVARYGDTKWVGAGEDRRIPFAYSYRDWVIQSLNEDVPYDRFVSLQLAADQMPDARPADRAALGFLTVGRWFTGNVHDVIDDQIDVVTRGLLGLSVQCARCHDHKFDPISAKDYYSLYGLFAAMRMPVEGAGLMADLPEVEPPPIDAAAAKEFKELRESLEKSLQDKLTSVKNTYRDPAKMETYLLAAAKVAKKTDNDVRALAKAESLNEAILFRWYRMLQRTMRERHAILGTWHAFAALPEETFADQAKAIAGQEAAQKPLNKHVVALVTPPPTSLADLAKKYVALFLKFDAAETAMDADQEAIRQFIRSNDSPVQISLSELGQFLTKDDLAQMARTRRDILAKVASLSERADQYLAFQHEAAPVVAEINEFLQKRQATLAAEIRSPEKIADCLLATREAEGADEAKIRSIANSRKIGEQLLRRWIEFLRKDNDVFAAWHEFGGIPEKEFKEKAAAVVGKLKNRAIAEAFAQPPASLKDAAKRYGEILAKQDAILSAPGSPLAFAPDDLFDYFSRKDLDELKSKENKLARLYLDAPGASPRAMAVRESSRGYTQKVFLRGNPNLPGDDAPSTFLAVLSPDKAAAFANGKGRAELAKAIVDPNNPLTARVLVNRVWQWHFGAGLVRTPSDFGTRGLAPTHPELLDALTQQFIADGWSLKKLHRRIMLSATYRQSSDDNPACRNIDPDNLLLWRMNRRRLTFEELRDSLLATGGRLDASQGGRPVDLTKSIVRRRTIFGAVDRNALPGFFRSFDFPSADAHIPERFETIVPQQALYMMNSSFVMDQAEHLARRTETATSVGDRIAMLYRLAYGRAPTADEVSLGQEFVAAEGTSPEKSPAVGPWRYGWGTYSESQKRVVDFQTFPFFGNDQWKGGPQEIDPSLGRMYLNSRGGNAGRDGSMAAIRRWIAPAAGKVSIAATLSCQPNSTQPSGDGVRGRIVSSRHGQLGVWLVHGTEEPTNIDSLEVSAGDTIDFVVDARGRENFGGFTWSPILTSDAVDAKGKNVVWDAAKDFRGTTGPAVARTLGVWERYAQALLESNEYLFLD